MVNGAYSDDADMKQAQKDNGMIEYGVNIPFLGENGGNVDLSFMPVVGTLLTEGAAIADAEKNNADLSGADKLVAGSSALLNTLIDSSALQGLQRLVGGSNSYSSKGLGENIKNTFESGLGQFVPSIARQVAQVQDDYERNISNGERDYAINNVLNSIPGIREQYLQPKVNSEGELVLQNQGRDTVSKVLENMFLPGTVKEYTPSEVREEQMRLFNEANGSDKQFGRKPSFGDLKTDTHEPTDAEFTAYSQDYQKSRDTVERAVIGSEYYNGLSDDEKISALAAVDTAMKAYAKENALDDYSTDDKIANAYRQGGVPAVLDYMERKHDFGAVGVSEGKRASAAYESGGREALQEYADTKKTLEAYGLTYNDKNAEVYNTYGTRGLTIQRNINGMESKKGSSIIPVLDKYDISDKDKGEFIINNLNTKVVTEHSDDPEYVYNVYKYAAGNIPDANGDGEINTYDAYQFLPALGYSSEDIEAMIKYAKAIRQKDK